MPYYGLTDSATAIDASAMGLAESLDKIYINKDFKTAFNKEIYAGKDNKQVRQLVVNQDPEPDELVPAGTPVNLIITAKNTIQVDSFNGISKPVIDKYEFVGDLITEIEKDDEIAAGARSVFEHNKPYAELSNSEKEKIVLFMERELSEEAVKTEKNKADVYNNMKFLINM